MTLGRLVPFVLSAATLIGAESAVVTAADVLDKMTEKERFGYITGVVDLAAYRAASSEANSKKAECIHTWFYGKDAKGLSEIVATFARYRERPAVGLIDVLIGRACGK